jgi:hypothetical protein
MPRSLVRYPSLEVVILRIDYYHILTSDHTIIHNTSQKADSFYCASELLKGHRNFVLNQQVPLFAESLM